jgi:hypothetical protein
MSAFSLSLKQPPALSLRRSLFLFPFPQKGGGKLPVLHRRLPIYGFLITLVMLPGCGSDEAERRAFKRLRGKRLSKLNRRRFGSSPRLYDLP